MRARVVLEARTDLSGSVDRGAAIPGWLPSWGADGTPAERRDESDDVSGVLGMGTLTA